MIEFRHYRNYDGDTKSAFGGISFGVQRDLDLNDAFYLDKDYRIELV